METSFSHYQAVVVDDEPLPRAHLAHLLKEAGVGTVLQASDAAHCLELFGGEEEAPDWVFLDIHMPGMDGMALADALGTGRVGVAPGANPPAVVFVTGYDDYAIQAFERAAIDYLLKPVDRARLAMTLTRLAANDQTALPATESLPPPLLQRLPIRMDYAVRLVDVADIVAATAFEKRVDVITRDKSYTTSYTLNQLELRLPTDRFARVHDSWIVNLLDVLEIHNLGSQNYQLRLRTDNRLVPVSRRRLPLLQQRLGL